MFVISVYPSPNSLMESSFTNLSVLLIFLSTVKHHNAPCSVRLFVCQSQALGLLSAAKGNYPCVWSIGGSEVLVCVSVIRGRMRIISHMVYHLLFFVCVAWFNCGRTRIQTNYHLKFVCFRFVQRPGFVEETLFN